MKESWSSLGNKIGEGANLLHKIRQFVHCADLSGILDGPNLRSMKRGMSYGIQGAKTPIGVEMLKFSNIY